MFFIFYLFECPLMIKPNWFNWRAKELLMFTVIHPDCYFTKPSGFASFLQFQLKEMAYNVVIQSSSLSHQRVPFIYKYRAPLLRNTCNKVSLFYSEDEWDRRRSEEEKKNVGSRRFFNMSIWRRFLTLFIISLSKTTEISQR